MTSDDFEKLLTQHQAKFTRKSIKNGVQFRCSDGEIFNVYDTGTVQPQGVQLPH